MLHSLEIIRLMPRLRRYARVLSGSQHVGDSLVAATLELHSKARLLENCSFPRLKLLRGLTDLWCSDLGQTLREAELQKGTSTARQPCTDLSSVDAASASPARQAFLLGAMEGLTAAEVGYVLRRDEQAARKLISSADTDIGLPRNARILIIEDELFVATDLETIVEHLGHEVVGLAATEAQAVGAARTSRPDLILSDIQLSDGSSGIDAVNEILGDIAVPVIFITAFPNRFLTGVKPEPAYLIEKPFRVEDVRAHISQALFFNQIPDVTAGRPAR